MVLGSSVVVVSTVDEVVNAIVVEVEVKTDVVVVEVDEVVVVVVGAA